MQVRVKWIASHSQPAIRSMRALDRWTTSEKGGMTHQLNRDMERKKRGDRTVRRAAPARPRREEHSAGRVDKFLAASLDLFAERNFASVTIKDIAKALNVNTALIYYYFDSKTDLFRATIEYAVAGAFENVRALDDRSADPPAIIAAWLANHVNKYAEIHRFVKIALDFRGAHEGDPDIANTIESFYIEERKLLSRVIREGIRRGMFKPVDPNRMAQFISTYLDGCMVRSVILPDFDLKGAVRDLHQRVLEMLGYSGKARGKPQRR
jgi:TetR/AcrR family transcriptional regulator, upper aerobic nicotinate degradation pathway regulator